MTLNPQKRTTGSSCINGKRLAEREKSPLSQSPIIQLCNRKACSPFVTQWTNYEAWDFGEDILPSRADGATPQYTKDTLIQSDVEEQSTGIESEHSRDTKVNDNIILHHSKRYSFTRNKLESDVAETWLPCTDDDVPYTQKQIKTCWNYGDSENVVTKSICAPTDEALHQNWEVCSVESGETNTKQSEASGKCRKVRFCVPKDIDKECNTTIRDNEDKSANEIIQCQANYDTSIAEIDSSSTSMSGINENCSQAKDDHRFDSGLGNVAPLNRMTKSEISCWKDQTSFLPKGTRHGCQILERVDAGALDRKATKKKSRAQKSKVKYNEKMNTSTHILSKGINRNKIQKAPTPLSEECTPRYCNGWIGCPLLNEDSQSPDVNMSTSKLQAIGDRHSTCARVSLSASTTRNARRCFGTAVYSEHTTDQPGDPQHAVCSEGSTVQLPGINYITKDNYLVRYRCADIPLFCIQGKKVRMSHRENAIKSELTPYYHE